MRLPPNHNRLAVILSAVLLGNPMSTTPAVSGNGLNAEKLRSSIENQGPAAALEQLAYRPDAFQRLEHRLRQGDQTWLDLFVDLRGHPENRWGTQLDRWLAYAVAHNAEAALRVMARYQQRHAQYFNANGFPDYAQMVCGNVDEDWSLAVDTNGQRGSPAESAIKALRKRKAALSEVGVSAVESTKRVCAIGIQRAIELWSSLEQSVRSRQSAPGRVV